MLTRLLIIDAPPGLMAAEIPDHPILCPGRIEVESGREGPRWLPPAPNCFYLNPRESLLYRADPDGTPIQIGSFDEILFGKDLTARLTEKARVGLTFLGCDVERLAVCLEDDTQVDLPVEKARAALFAGLPIILTRDVLRYAVGSAIEMIGKRYRHVHGDTLRRLFGTVA